MTQKAPLRETADRQARWVAMWREGVRASRPALALLELSSTRFIELSQRAEQLLRATSGGQPVLSYLAIVERPREAAETFRLVREGMIDGIRARRWYRRNDGSMVEVESLGQAIRSPAGPDLGLWEAREVRSENHHRVLTEAAFISSRPLGAGLGTGDARIVLDDQWRMVRISTEADLLLGRAPAELLNCSIVELTHPDDVPALLIAFARATSDSSVSVRVRLRHSDGSWWATEAAAFVPGDDRSFPFALAVAVDGAARGALQADGRSRGAGDLLRFAAELRSDGRTSQIGRLPDPSRFPGLSRLTKREWEVLARLLNGERVPSIAADLFVSQNTVRHHLSSIFAKVGVHSQAELIRYLRAN